MFPLCFIKLELVLMIVVLSGMRSYFYCSRLETYNSQIKNVTLKVLLVEFKDVKHRNPNNPKNLKLPAYTYNDYYNLLFSNNIYCSPNMYSPDGKKVFGSLNDYFRIMSNNKLKIQGYILNEDLNKDNVPDWLILDKLKSYYHNNRRNEFIEEAKEGARRLGFNIETNDSIFLVIIYAGHTYRRWGNTLNPAASLIGHEYIMGERFAAGYPYEEERNNENHYPISHFAHIGIHAHEVAHLLGFYDLIGVYDNQQWALMSSGNYNGPNNEGACPAPINPYFRWKIGWVNVLYTDSISRVEMRYDLSEPEIYIICRDFDKYPGSRKSKFIFAEYRKFNEHMKLGTHRIEDYNSHIKNLSLNDGLLVWREVPIGFVKLLHSCGSLCSNSDHQIFPGEKNVYVLSPWSDKRECQYNYYWIPNTKPFTDCGLEILSRQDDYFSVDIFQRDIILSTPSKPKNICWISEKGNTINWEMNMEPDFNYYKIYKRKDDSTYIYYDSSYYNSFDDSYENFDPDSKEYAYYKITAIDKSGKESRFSDVIKIPIKSPFTAIKEDINLLNLDIKLLQNFPNPFNPVTKIKYRIPNTTANILQSQKNAPTLAEKKVKMIIYDILGREITTLVDAEQKPGDYEIEFDGTNYSSGTYYYQIQTFDCVKTMKMILMK